jgi:putative intracellular protease/amidase
VLAYSYARASLPKRDKTYLNPPETFHIRQKLTSRSSTEVIDVAGPLDILNNASHSEMTSLASHGFPIPPSLFASAIPITFHHIGETLSPVLLTGNYHVVPTVTVDSCPPLDFLLVGGPDPSGYKLTPGFARLVKEHVERGGVLFTTCTGAMAIAPTGVLDGKNATTNHMGVPLAKQMYPNVKWTKAKQWVVDGENGQFWTSGGASAGMDMMAEWVKLNYGEEVLEWALECLDFERRDVEGKLVARSGLYKVKEGWGDGMFERGFEGKWEKEDWRRGANEFIKVSIYLPGPIILSLPVFGIPSIHTSDHVYVSTKHEMLNWSIECEYLGVHFSLGRLNFSYDWLHAYVFWFRERGTGVVGILFWHLIFKAMIPFF